MACEGWDKSDKSDKLGKWPSVKEGEDGAARVQKSRRTMMLSFLFVALALYLVYILVEWWWAYRKRCKDKIMDALSREKDAVIAEKPPTSGKPTFYEIIGTVPRPQQPGDVACMIGTTVLTEQGRLEYSWAPAPASVMVSQHALPVLRTKRDQKFGDTIEPGQWIIPPKLPLASHEAGDGGNPEFPSQTPNDAVPPVQQAVIATQASDRQDIQACHNVQDSESGITGITGRVEVSPQSSTTAGDFIAESAVMAAEANLTSQEVEAPEVQGLQGVPEETVHEE